jgi:hypothetical protein
VFVTSAQLSCKLNLKLSNYQQSADCCCHITRLLSSSAALVKQHLQESQKTLQTWKQNRHRPSLSLHVTWSARICSLQSRRFTQ